MVDALDNDMRVIKGGKQVSWPKRITVATAIVVGVFAAGRHVYDIIAWPFETKKEAATAHGKLEESDAKLATDIQAVRQESQRGNAQILEAIKSLGRELRPKKRE